MQYWGGSGPRGGKRPPPRPQAPLPSPFPRLVPPAPYQTSGIVVRTTPDAVKAHALRSRSID